MSHTLIQFLLQYEFAEVYKSDADWQRDFTKFKDALRAFWVARGREITW